MRRELTPLEQDVLRLIRGGGPYPQCAIIRALSNTSSTFETASELMMRLNSEGIIYTNHYGMVDTTRSMEEILQGRKEC